MTRRSVLERKVPGAMLLTEATEASKVIVTWNAPNSGELAIAISYTALAPWEIDWSAGWRQTVNASVASQAGGVGVAVGVAVGPVGVGVGVAVGGAGVGHVVLPSTVTLLLWEATGMGKPVVSAISSELNSSTSLPVQDVPRRTLAMMPLPVGPEAPLITQPNAAVPAIGFTSGPTQTTTPPVEARKGPAVMLSNVSRVGSKASVSWKAPRSVTPSIARSKTMSAPSVTPCELGLK